ncbi:PepSY-associated TM helix domain-containing protein [Hydrocarboniphaga sp.]|uniref:PepSY-associated TM helix domain-containing protein n=1 Tax=Hydrocarboniphaga sp. TaxID=2033016 RepID=UPI003D112D71
MSEVAVEAARRWPAYRAIWRWHFYAGLFCIPFVLWLATTGAIYLFKPQIDAFIDRPYDSLSYNGAPASVQAQVAAAVAALPSSSLVAYELPTSSHSAARVLVNHGGDNYRVYVHPQSLQILKTIRDEDRLMRVIFHLHGDLLIGDRGSLLVELAASWAIVMILSGLYLWWPRNAVGVAGVLYPRLGGGRRFWRDLHGVVGFWVSAFALFLLVSGLPWTQFWGANFKAVRQLGSAVEVRQDWSGGGKAKIDRAAMSAGGEHDHHQHGAGIPHQADPGAIDRVVASVAALQLAPPVLVVPPRNVGANWSARSDAQNRPLRVSLQVDGASGAIVQRQDFAQRPLLDRIVGTGVAAHEGQLFGWFNQVLGVLTALGLILLCVSALIMWWMRRPSSVLGAPLPLSQPRFAHGFIALLVGLGVFLPMLGVSMIAVLLVERLLLRRLPRAQTFLGLRQPA